MTLEQRVEALEKAVNTLKNKRFSITDGQVFIRNAKINEGSINTCLVSKSEGGKAVSNTAMSKTDSYYEELDKKLDYIISLMPSPVF